MANIPGAVGVLPGVFTDVITQSRGVSVPGGSRIAAIIGEGSTDETIVIQAVGKGQDGLNPSYAGVTGRDGRHFQLSSFPIISNRTTLYKNGIPLKGLESLIDNNPFSDKFDYRIDITTGRIELQKGHLLDQGGSLYTALSTNVGIGTLSGLALEDVNALPQTWTIRCVKVQRTTLNAPVPNTATFIAFGSVTGAVRDANGNEIIWKANGNEVSNGVFKFAIVEGLTPFREGDGFTIIVASGILSRNDSLTANYIPQASLNDPQMLQGLGDVTAKHGFPSLSNTLALGAQLAFANQAPALMALQAAPPLPRRTSYLLDSNVNALSLDPETFKFPLPVGVIPNVDANIHFFLQNNATNTESQVLPNKFPYYSLNEPGEPTLDQFVMDDIDPPGGNSYSYTVVQDLEAMSYGENGQITLFGSSTSSGLFGSPSVQFDSTYVGKALKIKSSNNSSNYGVFHVSSVSGGKLYFEADGHAFAPSTLVANESYLSDFISDASSSTTFRLVNKLTNLPVVGSDGNDGNVVSFGPNTGEATLSSDTIALSKLAGSLQVAAVLSGPPGIETQAAPIGNDGEYKVSLPIMPFVSAATNASPIEITSTFAHGLSTGDVVTIENVAGNTAANGTFTVTVVSPTEFSLDGSTGTGVYTSGGTVYPHKLILEKAIVAETGLEYEVLDPLLTSSYIVVNHNVVPNGFGLRVTIVDEKDASFYDVGWIRALEALEAVDCDIVVSLPKQTISVIFQNTLAHCQTMSNIRNRKERVMFSGAISGLTPENVIGAKLAAVENIGILEGIQGETVTDILEGNIEDLADYSVSEAYGGTFRNVYFYPDQIVVQAGADNAIVDGFYLAAAAAGYTSADVKIQNPLTNKVLTGFSILRSRMYSPLVLEQLAAAGITVLQPVAGGGKVVWGKTTSQSGYPEEEEISVVFIRDRVAKVLRGGFQAFVGQPESPTTQAALNTRAVIILNSLVSQGLITRFADLSVKRDDVDPTQWNISVRVQPTYPVNFIYIKINIGQL